MAMKEGDGLDGFLFSESAKLEDLKCFRGDRDDITEDDVRTQIHSAFMQRKMKRATVTADPPSWGVEPMDVREFVANLEKTC